DDIVLDNGFELVDGQIVEKPMGAKANVVGLNLTSHLSQHVKTNNLGHVFFYEVSYQFRTGKRKQIRKPDVSFIARGRFPNNELPDGHLTFAPDLAGEIISPND